MCWRFVGRWVVRSKVLTRTTQCMPGCPSGQRERTVNPPALPSEVRIFYLAQFETPRELSRGVFACGGLGLSRVKGGLRVKMCVWLGVSRGVKGVNPTVVGLMR